VDAFKKKLASLNLSLDLEVSYVSGDETSMLEVAQQLEGTSAEAVLIPDSVDASAKLLANLSPSLKKRMRPLGTALWDNIAKVARSQALFERAIFVTPFFTQSNRPEVQQFINSFKGKYNTAPNFLAAQGFDAGTLIVNALRKAIQDGSTFEPALRSLPPYTGVTGLISVLPSGEVSRSFYVVEVMRDSFQEKMPMSNPSRYDSSNVAADAANSSQAPRLGDTERVESGY
jgi:branched-chain amino acid transport system substrate-binding protein